MYGGDARRRALLRAAYPNFRRRKYRTNMAAEHRLRITCYGCAELRELLQTTSALITSDTPAAARAWRRAKKMLEEYDARLAELHHDTRKIDKKIRRDPTP